MTLISRLKSLVGFPAREVSTQVTPVTVPTPTQQQPPQEPPVSTDPAIQFLQSGEWLLVGSTNVAEWRYLWEDQILEVEFLTGGVYQYYDVPVPVARGFYYTSSPGRYVWQFLRDRYPYAKLEGVSTTRKRKPQVIRTLGTASNQFPQYP